jgi:hypothetical protein
VTIEATHWKRRKWRVENAGKLILRQGESYYKALSIEKSTNQIQEQSMVGGYPKNPNINTKKPWIGDIAAKMKERKDQK